MKDFIKQQIRIFIFPWGVSSLNDKKDVVFYLETSCPKNMPEMDALIYSVEMELVFLLCELIDVKRIDTLLDILIKQLKNDGGIDAAIAEWVIHTWYELIIEYRFDKESAMTLETLRDLAEQGNPAAQLNLGLKYEQASELSEAEYWYKKSADQDYPLAFLHLGDICDLTTDAGRHEATNWYYKAIDADCVQAYYQLRHVIRLNIAHDLNT